MGSSWKPSSSFKPFWALSLHHHLQTLAPALSRKGFSRQELEAVPIATLELSDGDFLEYRDFFPIGDNQPKHWALLCHGFEGTWDAGYLKQGATYLQKQGFGVRIWMYRSCGHTPNRLARFYHSGATDDLAAMHAALEGKVNPTRVDIVGFSLGGNLVTRYAAEISQGLYPRLSLGKLVSISAPLDLACSSRLIGDTAWGVYCQIFLPSLYKKIKAKLDSGLLPPTYRQGLKAKNVWDFDEYVTAPLHGFGTAQAYYDAVAGIYCIKEVKLPLLLIAAHDDMLISQSSLIDVSDCHDLVQSCYLAKGGHLGFLGTPKDWMMQTVVDWLRT